MVWNLPCNIITESGRDCVKGLPQTGKQANTTGATCCCSSVWPLLSVTPLRAPGIGPSDPFTALRNNAARLTVAQTKEGIGISWASMLACS